jgi:glycosyltransferase involved in cell wall biosynthesis
MTQITQCIKLICVQSYKDFEIICIDDCSEDSTLQVLNMIQKENSSVRVISNKSRLFVSSCRSIGIKEAKGEYLIFIDSDDMLMDSSFFQKSVDTFLNNKEIDIIIGKTLI